MPFRNKGVCIREFSQQGPVKLEMRAQIKTCNLERAVGTKGCKKRV